VERTSFSACGRHGCGQAAGAATLRYRGGMTPNPGCHQAR
jgi:hypothetical protein